MTEDWKEALDQIEAITTAFIRSGDVDLRSVITFALNLPVMSLFYLNQFLEILKDSHDREPLNNDELLVLYTGLVDILKHADETQKLIDSMRNNKDSSDA